MTEQVTTIDVFGKFFLIIPVFD